MGKTKLFFCFPFFFFFFGAFAQDERTAIPLKLILDRISAQHQVRFSYAEDELVVYKLEPPNDQWTLSAKIDYIKSATRLQFKSIDQKYFSIYNNKKMDKPLCGFLTDSETGFPVEDAIIVISRSNISVMSDYKGYFELPVISSDIIVIKHLNYAPFQISPSEMYTADCIQIKLIPDVQQLDEVITQRYLATGISKVNDGSVQVKPRKFGILPGLTEADVLQTMQQIPGIFSVDESISNINVRGGTHDQNLFLWNGIRMFQTGHFFGQISAFNPSLSHTVSIAKNGTSAFYGESVSSLVDMSARSQAIESTVGSASINWISAEFYSKLKISPRADIEVSGRRSFTDLLSSPTYKNYRRKIFQNTIVTDLNNSQRLNYETDEDFDFYDFSVQYQQQIGSRHSLAVNGIAIKNNLVLNQHAPSANRTSGLSQQNFGGTIAWNTKWNEKNSTDAKYYISYYNLDATNESVTSTQVLDQRNEVLNIGAQVKNSWQLSKTFNLDYGYQFDEIAVTNSDFINTPALSRINREILQTHAVIIEGVYHSFSKRTYLRAGTRFNYFDTFSTFIPELRLQFNHAFTDKLNMEIQSEQKSQTLSQVIDLQQDFLGIEKRRWILSNDSTVPIQTSDQFSVGFTYKNKNWLFALDNFYKEVKGITSRGQGFQNQFETLRSVGSYEVWGSEILVQKSFNRFYTWFSYSFNDNKYHFDEFTPTTFSSNFELTHFVSWAGIYEWKKIKVALGGKWHSGKPITTPIFPQSIPATAQIEYNRPNTENLYDYFQLNLSASKDWDFTNNVKVQTTISLLNILNNNNIINRFYRINAATNSIEKVDIYSLERTPNVNVKVIF